MATFYLDFENGNDSNDGTTFANRWKTITSGATAARTAPGDMIRIMKSPDPVSLGVNATFTNKSPTITLASAVTANIDTGETAWSTNFSSDITCSTSATRKEGSLAATFSIGAAFTTSASAMVYKATGTLDLSAYQNISFWFRTSIATAANTFRIDLCSDAAGVTAVNSFTIDQAMAANVFKPFTFKNGAALSSSIQSIAIRALLDPGASTNLVTIDNVFACNNLHLNSLIGTSSSATNMVWYPIRSVNGTTIIIESEQNNIQGTNTSRGWHDTTTTTTAYVRDTVRLTTNQTVNEAGSVGNFITYSGGWDRTNMSTQDGVTFLASDRNLLTAQTIHTNSLARLAFDRIGVLWGAIPFTSAGQFNRFTNCGAYAASGTFAVSIDSYVDNFAGISCQASPMTATSAKVSNSVFYSNGATGLTATNGYCIFNDISSSNNTSNGVLVSVYAQIQDLVARDNTAAGLNVSGAAEVNGIITSGNTSAGITNTGFLRLNNASIYDTTAFSSTTLAPVIRASRYSTFKGYQYGASQVLMDDTTSIVHGSATRSYRHMPSANHFSGVPLVQPLQPFAVNGSALVTFKIWVYRTSTNVEGRVRLKGWVSPGVDADVTATGTAAINTWEELTVTCTPSAAGVVQIDLESYSVNGSTGTVYFGDATVTQA